MPPDIDVKKDRPVIELTQDLDLGNSTIPLLSTVLGANLDLSLRAAASNQMEAALRAPYDVQEKTSLGLAESVDYGVGVKNDVVEISIEEGLIRAKTSCLPVNLSYEEERLILTHNSDQILEMGEFAALIENLGAEWELVTDPSKPLSSSLDLSIGNEDLRIKTFLHQDRQKVALQINDKSFSCQLICENLPNNTQAFTALINQNGSEVFVKLNPELDVYEVNGKYPLPLGKTLEGGVAVTGDRISESVKIRWLDERVGVIDCGLEFGQEDSKKPDYGFNFKAVIFDR